MSFCNKCGYELDTDDLFCSHCGAPVKTSQSLPAPASAPQKPLENKKSSDSDLKKYNLIVDFANIKEYFEKKQDTYKKLSEVINNIDETKSHRRLALLITGIVLSGLSPVLLVLIFTSSLVVGTLAQTTSLSGSSHMMAQRPWYFYFFIFLFIVGIALIIAWIIDKIKRKRLVYDYEIEEIRLNAELTDYYKEFGFCALNPEYTNPAVLRKLDEIVSSGKVDSFPKAIEVYLNQTHKSASQFESLYSHYKKIENEGSSGLLMVFSASVRFFEI